MLKQYIYNGKQFQFEDGQQPSGAVELKGKPPQKAVEEKAAAPANKSRRPANKGRAVKTK